MGIINTLLSAPINKTKINLSFGLLYIDVQFIHFTFAGILSLGFVSNEHNQIVGTIIIEICANYGMHTDNTDAWRG